MDNQNQQTGYISEQFVQDMALEFLRLKYSKSFIFSNNVTALQEVYTQEKNRADGLAFFKRGNSYFTASLEAKSYKTLYALKEQIDENQFNTRRQVFWAISGISYIVALTIFQADFLHSMLFWFGFHVLGDFFLFHNNTDKNSYKFVEVMRQIEQYPANEQWLAVSEDCFSDKVSEDYLIKICSKASIGLLCVSAEGDVDILLKASKQQGDFLHFYSSDSRIGYFLPSG